MFREVLGQQVHTVSFGAGSPAIVAMSGAFGTSEIWQQPFELLSRRHRVIGFDHFGVGETRCPPEMVTFERQVELAIAMLDVFEVDQCVLMGDSAMCATAIEVARRAPERVQALLLVSGGPATPASEETLRLVAGLGSAFEQTVNYFAGLCVPEDPAGHLRAWLADIISRTGPEGCIRLVESFYGVDVRAVLPGIRVPTLVVHGQLDTLAWSNVEAAQALAKGIPGARLLELPGTGHVPQLSRPAELVEAIEQFAGSLQTAAVAVTT